MKEQSINFSNGGFSTLELLIALTLMTIVMTGALQSIWGNQYWLMTASTAHEAMQKNKMIIDSLKATSRNNFQLVSSTPSVFSVDPNELSDQGCLSGGLCYQTEAKVNDISSCAKTVSVDVRWQLGLRYPTSTITTNTYIANTKEISAVGGDCLVTPPLGNWGEVNLMTGTVLPQTPFGTSAIDVLGNYMYVTSALEPYLRVFKISSDPTVTPQLVSYSAGANIQLNDIDVVRDFSTGRLYAYVTQHSTSSQLAVYDVTDAAAPTLLVQLSLFNVASNGSFPQGWRVMAYGEKLYVVSRETTGPELHIFSIVNPRLPVEINSAAVNLNRTVNDMVVRDEVKGGTVRRYLYLAASADLKEVGVYDVSGTIPIEVAAINLAGTADASSLYLTGNILYIGRKSSNAPELYALDALKLTNGEFSLRGSSEVGTEVLALSGVGSALILGTAKNGEEVQLWNPNVLSWSPTIVNAGRFITQSSPRLPPLGFDMYGNHLYLVSHSQTQPEAFSIVFSP